MIKNLLGDDDEKPVAAPSPENITIEEKDVNPKTNETLVHDDDGQITTTNPPRKIFEIPEDAKFFTTIPEVSEDAEKPQIVPGEESKENEESNQTNDLRETEIIENPQIQMPNAENLYAEIVNEQDETKNSQAADEESASAAETPVFQNDFKSETPDETNRKSGMAYSAAIVLVASIVFTMILGWFADLLLGTSPWGIVGGIILGSIIGFVQFFRITSSILK